MPYSRGRRLSRRDNFVAALLLHALTNQCVLAWSSLSGAGFFIVSPTCFRDESVQPCMSVASPGTAKFYLTNPSRCFESNRCHRTHDFGPPIWDRSIGNAIRHRTLILLGEENAHSKASSPSAALLTTPTRFPSTGQRKHGTDPPRCNVLPPSMEGLYLDALTYAGPADDIKETRNISVGR